MTVSKIFTIFLILSSTAQAAMYGRFWRGTKKETKNGLKYSDKSFIEDLNKVFLKATVDTGSGKGLVSYIPALPKDGIFPDEIALVLYSSEKAYRDLRETEKGQAYQTLHFDYFEKEKSKSLAPEPYVGKIEAEHAYDFFGSDAAWNAATGTAYLYYFSKTNPEEMRPFFERYHSESHDVISAFALVAADYSIVYALRSKKAKAPKGAVKIRFAGLAQIKKKPLKRGEAISLKL